MPGGDKDYFASLENIERVAEELVQAGIDKDIIIKLASDVLENDLGEVDDFLKLALQKDALVTKYVAKPVPELQAFLSEAILGKLRRNGFTIEDSVQLPPEYVQYSEAQIIASLPKFMRKSISMQGDVLNLKVSPRLADKYVFRADTGGLSGGKAGSAFVRSPGYEKIMQDIKTMDKLFDVFVNQKGIGHKATDEVHSGIFVAEKLDIAAYCKSEFGYKEGGFWVISKDALLNVPLKIEEYDLGNLSCETEFADVIPFKYVQYLIVTPENRATILAKYGAGNTEIFGRPLKDVVLEVDKYEIWTDYVSKFLQTRISESQ